MVLSRFESLESEYQLKPEGLFWHHLTEEKRIELFQKYGDLPTGKYIIPTEFTLIYDIVYDWSRKESIHNVWIDGEQSIFLRGFQNYSDEPQKISFLLENDLDFEVTKKAFGMYISIEKRNQFIYKLSSVTGSLSLYLWGDFKKKLLEILNIEVSGVGSGLGALEITTDKGFYWITNVPYNTPLKTGKVSEIKDDANVFLDYLAKNYSGLIKYRIDSYEIPSRY